MNGERPSLAEILMQHIDGAYRTRLYRNGASQAVRIPKELAYPEDIEVELIRRGDEVIVRPVERRLEGLGEALRRMGEAMRGYERDEGDHQEREWSKRHRDRDARA